MLANHSSRAGPHPWPTVTPGLGITDMGIVCGDGVILAHMTISGDRSHVSPEAHEDRLVALLSVIGGRPVAPADVLHHVTASARRLRVATDLLDDGLSFVALMKAIWPEQADPLNEYPGQSRIEAGNGVAAVTGSSRRPTTLIHPASLCCTDSTGSLDVRIARLALTPASAKSTR